MRRFYLGLKWSALLSVATFVVSLVPVHAESPPSTPRIGVVLPAGGARNTEEGLVLGLRERGYVVGKDIILDWRRYSEGWSQVEALTIDLLRSRPDILIAVGTPPARAALAGTSTIPVVFIAGDPTSTGLAESLARPGANATGVSILSAELTPKRLEYLHEVVPQARRIAYLMNPSNPVGGLGADEAQKRARALGLALEVLEARDGTSLDAALGSLRRRPPDGVLVSGDGIFLAHKHKVARTLAEIRRPAIFAWREYHDEGVLMSYGPSMKDAMRTIAIYVDKILKGAKPSELPVEQLTKYDLVIDLRAAHAMGISLPEALLVRADELIR